MNSSIYDDQSFNWIIGSFYFKDNFTGVCIYETDFSSFNLGLFPCNFFSSCLVKLQTQYQLTHYLFPLKLPEEVTSLVSIQKSVLFCKNSDFSYSNSLCLLSELEYTASGSSLTNLQQSFRNILGFESPNFSQKCYISSIGAILSFLKNKKYPLLASSIEILDFSTGIQLSTRTLEDLQIFNDDQSPTYYGEHHSTKSFSLFSLLNHTSTQMGAITLRKYLLGFYSTQEHIINRQNQISFLSSPEGIPIANSIIGRLHFLPEIRHLFPRLQRGTMTRQNWSTLRHALHQAADLMHFNHISKISSQQSLSIINSEELFQKLIKAIENIEGIIDFKNKTEIYILDKADSKLSKLRSKLNSLPQFLDQISQTLISQNSEITSLKVVFIPQIGFLAKIPTDSLFDINDTDFKLIFKDSDHYYFKTLFLKNLDKDPGDISALIAERELRVITELSISLLQLNSDIFSLWAAFGELDAILSLSIISADEHWVKPNLGAPILSIKGSRHPLYERHIEHFIPNDFELINGKKIYIIRGPNGSGKSVFLKQIALIVFMAHIGCFVPAEAAEVPWVDKILTVMHRQPSEAPFSSGFSEEASLAGEAVKLATENSLVIADEFGKSTNVREGSALLEGLLFYLSEKKTLTLTATHFDLNSSDENCCNLEMNVSQSDEGDLFLYKVHVGNGNGSHGLECAEKAGIGNDVIERARQVKKAFENGSYPEAVQILTLDESKNHAENLHKKVESFLRWNGGESATHFLDRLLNL